MDPVMLAFMLSTGMEVGTDIISALVGNSEADKERQDKAEKLAKAYAFQQSRLDRQISQANKNRRLNKMETLDEMSNFNFGLSQDDVSRAEQFAAQMYRGGK